MLTLASEYLVKFYNFYPHLSLKTVFPVLNSTGVLKYLTVLKLPQIVAQTFMNISFLENWQFNHKLTLLHTYQAWKIALTIWQNIKVSGTQKYQFFNSLVNWEKFGSTA